MTYLNDRFTIYIVPWEPVDRLVGVSLDIFASETDNKDLLTIRFEAEEAPDWPEQVHLHVYWMDESVLIGEFDLEMAEELGPGQFVYMWSRRGDDRLT